MSFNDYESSTPRQSRAGPTRSDSNARMHSLTKPYQRPAQREQTDEFGQQSPTKQAVSTRPGLQKSASAYSLGALTRSGSDTSLFSGLKSLISRPLGWLATPARKKKQPDVDAEMGPESGMVRKRSMGRSSKSPSPDYQRGTKKMRQHSPTQENQDMDGDYAPRASSSRQNGLPSLGPDVSLSRRGKAAVPNFSRPLPTSRSEAYLDMPQSMLGSPSRTTRGMTRSSGMNLAGMANGSGEVVQEHYSPWGSRYDSRTRASITPARGLGAEVCTLHPEIADLKVARSGSPFGTPLSPSARRNTSGLTRSSTLAHMQRPDSLAGRAATPRGGSLAPSRSMAFGGDDGMSVDGDRATPERYNSGSLAAFNRITSPSLPNSPSKGSMRWDAGSQGFSRTFGAPLKQEVHQNEAERIFMGLQASSNVATGRAKSTDAGIPMDMLGASSRDLRKAIKVPLVARQTAEKRQRERLGDNHNVLISPYGRTQSVHREEQQRRREQSRERSREQSAQMEIDRESQMRESVSPAPQAATPRRSARNKRKESEEPTPQATPRNKGKWKRAESAQSEEERPRSVRRSSRRTPSERGSPPPPTKASAPPPVPTITETAPSPISQPKASGSEYRVRSAEEMAKEKSSLRAASAFTTRQHGAGMSTSRNGSRTGSRQTSPDRGSGRFSAREEDLPSLDDLSNGKIALPSFGGVSIGNLSASTPTAPPPSLAPPAEKPKLSRPPQGPLSRSRQVERRKSPLATQPVISANTEPDTPPQAKTPAPAPAFAPEPIKAGADGFFSFGGAKPAAPAPSNLFGAAGEKKAGADLGIGRPPAPAPKPVEKPAEIAPPKSTFSFGAAAAAPPPVLTVAKGGASSGSVFGGQAVDVEGLKAKTDSQDPMPPAAPAKEAASFSFGVSKPAETAAPKPFGGFGEAKSAPSAPKFNFGKPATSTPEPAKSDTPSFAFGATSNGTDKPAGRTTPTSAFGKSDSTDKPAAAATSFDFGKTTTVDKPASTGFTFGSTPADKPASTGFTFGATPATDKPAEAPKANPFGAPAASTPAADKPAFSFGAASATPTTPTAEKASTFSFGAGNAAAASTTTPAFGKPADTAATGSGFGSAASKPAEPASSSFSFGANPADAPSTNFAFGSTPAAKPAEAAKTFGFGQSSSAAPDASAGNAFGQKSNAFGAPAASTTPGAFGSFGGASGASSTPAPAFGSQPAKPFGTTPAANGASSSFTFGSDTNKAAPAFGSTPAPAFGSAAPSAPATNSFTFGSSTATNNTNGTSAFGSTTNAFGSAAPAFGSTPAQPANGGFTFGATNTTNNAAPANNAPGTFNFGSQPSTPAATNGTFAFGTPTSSTQPFAFGSQPNSPAVTKRAFDFGAPNAAAPAAPGGVAARFGSPGPGGIASTEGGFSMGAAAAPGSPGGRIIKPLRRKK